MKTILQDLRHAVHILHRSPGFTAVAVLTLALAIGATTAIFSVVYGVLLKPLPYSDPNRIMALYEVNPRGDWSRLADPNFDDFRDQNRSFQAIAKYTSFISSVSGAAQPTRSMVASVSYDFFNVFRVQPIMGRGLNRADTVKGAARDRWSIRSDGLFRQPAHARDWSARCARRSLSGCPNDDPEPGNAHDSDRNGNRSGCVVCSHARSGVAALRRDGNRPADIRGSDPAAGRGRAAGMLHSGKARDESRSDGRFEGRIVACSFVVSRSSLLVGPFGLVPCCWPTTPHAFFSTVRDAPGLYSV